MEPELDAPPEVPISAIEHVSYCPRQCALIHLEQTFDDNLFTVRGRIAHERVHSGLITSEDGVRVERDVPLWSERLGLRGRADVVEFHRRGPVPIEYKSGRRRHRHAELQVCAQALCLEEMLGVSVPTGVLYLIGARRRVSVRLDDDLRRATEAAVQAVHELLGAASLPAAPNDARCPACSLLNVCLPQVVAEPARLRGLPGALFRPRTGSGPDV